MPRPSYRNAAKTAAAAVVAFACMASSGEGNAAAFKTLHSFASGEGSSFAAGLTVDADNVLYGVRSSGIAFAFATKELTVEYTFNNQDNSGYLPMGNLVKDAEGNLYGTTNEGGENNDGTIFKITPDGTLTTLYEFAGGADGSYPTGNLILDKSGNLYGVTSGSFGEVFEFTPDGSLITLHSFNSNDGAYPQGPLLLGPNQVLYGVTSLGGPDDNGTVFQVSLNGDFQTLFLFSREQGRNIVGGLLQDQAGTLYGVTAYGGSADDGSIYSLTKSGTFTTLHSFVGKDGRLPTSGLLKNKDGSFFGATYYGGKKDDGVIYSFSTNHTLTVLHSFSGTAKDGKNPLVPVLTLYKKDSLVGTTSGGGQNSTGTIFEITP